MITVTIINRHYPPNPGVTGESAWDLANYLINNHGFQVHIVYVNRLDDGGGQIRKPVGKLFPVNTIYKGKNKNIKLISGFLDGWQLVFKGIFLSQGPVICMTSPPLLPLWFSWIAKLLRKKWAFWSMDLFPEFFVPNGLLNSNALFYKLLHKLTYYHAPNLLIALGYKQAEFINKKYIIPIESVVLPCGVFISNTKDNELPDWKDEDNKIYFGYCGNLGNAHSIEFIIEFINLMNPEIHCLVLAVYGPYAPDILEYAKEKIGVKIVDTVPRSSLHHLDIHLVSLKSNYNHIAVPSKAVSSICVGATVLFYGSSEVDAWYMLNKASWLIDECQDLRTQLTTFLETLSLKDINERKQNASIIANALHDDELKTYEKIALWITNNQ